VVLRREGLRLYRGRGGEDFFVHYTAVVGEGFRTLQEGSEVEFEIVEDGRGRKQAARVEVVG
jgi:CspA family cold shock protein